MTFSSGDRNSAIFLSPRRKVWGITAATVVAIGGLVAIGAARNKSQLQATAPPPPPAVRVQDVSSESVARSSEFVGALNALERVTLRSEAEGRVQQILVREGERVEAGTPIVQLEFDRPQAQVDGALANVMVARAAQNSAQAQLLAAQADRDREAAEVALQMAEFERTELLVGEGAISVQELDRVRRDRDAAVAALNAADRRVASSEAVLEETEAAIAQANSNATVAQEDLDDYNVLAPIAGVIGDIPIEVGDYVETDTVLTSVVQNATLELRLAIPIEQARGLRPDLEVQLTLPGEDEPIASGQIDFVSPRVDATRQVILAKASFDNPEGLLRDEQFVTADIIWEEISALTVPTSAVSFIGNQAFVYVVGQAATEEAGGDASVADGLDAPPTIAQLRPVQLGTLQRNTYAVTSGLDAGETIVTSGLLNLFDGAAISPETGVATLTPESETPESGS
ncbi:MAG: efflux RND transporter periplasmic adaptor subunit [Cyanobacteria bacterium P01_A01_bin.3]